jgi:hypothetical protein
MALGRNLCISFEEDQPACFSLELADDSILIEMK